MASFWDDLNYFFTGSNHRMFLPSEGGPAVESDPVDHPSHYKSGGMEAIDVIEAFFHDNYFRGNVFKYISRAGRKDPAKELEDLRKARVYLEREIARVEGSDG